MAAKVLDGRYKLIKTLGAGGFGRTYIARDMRRPNTPACVVKHLKPASDDAGFIREARRLFNTEAETLEKLGRHDQIPQLLAYFEEDQQFFLVQEFIEGRSLYSELKPEIQEDDEEQITDFPSPTSEPKRGKQLSEPEVIAILKDILNVLEFVHAEGVIHRDIKPDNLIRRKKDGKIVLIDFGAVKAMQEGGAQIEEVNGQSRFTVTIGTPGFMPSEQCAGRPTFSSDLYATGMVVIKALTGYDPTELPTDPDTGEVIWRDKARVSNGLAMVLTRMVRYQYTQRYQSAREALQGLAAFAITAEEQKKSAAAIVKSSKTTTTKTVARSQTKSNSGSGLLVAGLLVMIGGTTFYLTTLSRSPQKSDSSPAPIVRSSSTTTTTTTTNPPVSTTTSPQNPPESPSPAPIGETPETPDPTLTNASNFSQSLTTEVGKPVAREGAVKANQVISYTLSATEGQKLQTNIAGEGVTMTVLAPNNQPVDSNASQTATWDGTLPSSGQYQIQIKTSPDKAESNYTLNVTLGEKSTTPIRNVEIKINPQN